MLYNAKSANGAYRITKFTSDLDVEASYLTTEKECSCPAAARPTCRHRQMLPMFIGAQRVDSFWFLDWEAGRWKDPFNKSKPRWRRF
jgi:hypothetical protein